MYEKSYKWLSILRISSVTAILGSAVYYLKDIFGLVFAVHLALLIFLIYAITLALWSYIKRKRPRIVFAYLLFALDITIYTLIIFTTGGLDSSFLFLYAIAVIAAAIVLSTRGAFFAATYSSLMLFFMALLIYRNIVPPTEFFDKADNLQVYDSDLFFQAFFQSLFLFLIAAFSSYFTEAIKSKTIELGKLRESLMRARMDTSAILQNIPSGVIVADKNGKIHYINDAARQILNLNGEKISNLRQIGGQWPQVYSDFERYVSRSEVGSAPFKSEISREDKSYIVTLSRFSDSDRYILTIEDITEQRRLQEKLREQERYALLGQQMAEMVHSLGNPVAALKGVAQILQSGTSQENMQKLLKIMEQELSRVSSILHRYRQFSGVHAIFPQPIKLREFFNSLVRKVRYMNESGGVEIVLGFRNSPEIAEFDAEKLEEALVNMVRNSIEALHEGGTIKISVCGQEESIEGFRKHWKIPTGQWGVCISDNGTGISREAVNKIFTPSFTTKAQGLGLGLAITKRIIEVHGGSIDFDTEQGKGTIFVVTLPLKVRS